MKILITGARGQLAKEFQKFFDKKNISYLALSKENLDITNFNLLEKLVSSYKPTLIINCAAYNHVDLAEKEYEKAYKINALGPYNLALLAKKYKFFLIHYSTDYVFDGEKKECYIEEDVPNPINKYGKTKVIGEKNIKKVLDKNYLIFRISWVYGGGKSNFLHKLCMWSKNKKKLFISCDEFSIPTSTKFIVEKSMKAYNIGLQGIFHLTPNDFTSRYEYAKIALSLLNKDIKVYPMYKEEFNLPAKRPFCSALDSKKIQKELNENFLLWQEYLEYFLKNDILKF